jgi:hypothetical protein
MTAEAGVSARLQLLDEGGNTILADTEGSGMRSPRIVAIVPLDGGYLVRAIAPTQQTGSYAIELTLATAAPPPAGPRALSRDGPTADSLALASEALIRGPDQLVFFYRYFELPVVAGETVTVEMRTTEFRPYLDIGVMSPLGFATLTPSFAPAPGGVRRSIGPNSYRLTFQPERDGQILLRARSAGAAVGAFTLTVSSGSPTPPPTP